MKKKALLSLFILPLILSCNQNSNGFVNPFPDDDYNNNHKIGFKLDSVNESIARSLTEREKKNISDTIADEDLLKHITKKTNKRYVRDYTRAFAGEFKQGYATYNMMEDSEESMFLQLSDKESSYRTRLIENSSSNKTISYTYGSVKEKTEYKIKRYLSNWTEKEYLELDEESKEEKEMYKNLLKEFDHKEYKEKEKYAKAINSRITKTENEKYVKVSDKFIHGFVNEEEYLKGNYLKDYFYIDQNDFIWTPDDKCGADINDNMILVKSEQSPYKKGTSEGIYELQDGRKYKAMTNSIKVSKLKLIKVTEDDVIKDRCIVYSARTYTEDIITSDVIQPNVPISFLSTPIPLHYEEEYTSFDISSVEKDTTSLDETTKGLIDREVIEL